jgi:hypothetical protein
MVFLCWFGVLQRFLDGTTDLAKNLSVLAPPSNLAPANNLAPAKTFFSTNIHVCHLAQTLGESLSWRTTAVPNFFNFFGKLLATESQEAMESSS